MVIELGGVAFEIICRFEQNKRFFEQYASPLQPAFTIEPTQQALADIKQAFLRTHKGEENTARSEAFYENNALHALIAEALIPYGVLLMHGSALSMDGEAVVFTAPSGTGKSTHARLWRESFGERVKMINDDKPLIRLTDTRALVFGSPWNGKHRLGSNISAPLKAIVYLRQSEENEIRPLSKLSAFPILVSQCFASREPGVMQRITALEKQLLDRVDFYELKCNMRPEAALAACKAIFHAQR